jgi:hypothetical protein
MQYSAVRTALPNVQRMLMYSSCRECGVECEEADSVESN